VHLFLALFSRDVIVCSVYYKNIIFIIVVVNVVSPVAMRL